MKKRIKQGFTLVELVIVIAVIAILAAVLIPTFSNLITKSKNSVDTQLIRNLNTSLQEDKVLNGKHQTLYDVNEALKESGYDINKMDLSSDDYQLLWDSINDVFCYYNGKSVKYISDKGLTKVNGDHDYFGIYDKIPAENEQKFSIYYKGSGSVNATVTVGFDAGTSGVNVNYTVDEKNNNSVIIRTNGGNLTVNAPNGDITHYGAVNKLNVIAVNPDHCFHEYGYVYELGDIFPETKEGSNEGKFVAEDAKFHQSEEEVNKKFEFKKFEKKKIQYNQHYYGPNNESDKCLCPECNKPNPNHICVAGTPQEVTEGNTKYIVVKCSLCEKELTRAVIGEIKKEPCEEHSYEEKSSIDASCTVPGIKLFICKECGDIKIESTLVLGHKWEVIAGKSATCTETGLTESKTCTREGCTVTVEAISIPAKGHNYDRTTHMCKNCNEKQPTVTMNSILNGIERAEKNYNENTETYVYNPYVNLTRSITFGYKSDYINKINGVKFDCNIEGIDIIGSFVLNPNYGKEYSYSETYPKYIGSEELVTREYKGKDNREYVIDLYVLSDLVIEYECYAEKDNGLFALYGIGIVLYCEEIEKETFCQEGALEKIVFENFDTTNTKNFGEMFNLMYIKSIDISSFVINKGAISNDFFLWCVVTGGEDAVKYPNNFPEEYKYKHDTNN